MDASPATCCPFKVLCVFSLLGWPVCSEAAKLRCGTDLLNDLLFVCGDRGIYFGKGAWSGYGSRPRGKGIVDKCCRSNGCDLHHLEVYCAKPKTPQQNMARPSSSTLQQTTARPSSSTPQQTTARPSSSTPQQTTAGLSSSTPQTDAASQFQKKILEHLDPPDTPKREKILEHLGPPDTPKREAYRSKTKAGSC
nr:insulin-like growth factor I, adult form [Nerophis lumbriciformis]